VCEEQDEYHIDSKRWLVCTYDHTILSNVNIGSNGRSLDNSAFTDGDMVADLHWIVAERPSGGDKHNRHIFFFFFA